MTRGFVTFSDKRYAPLLAVLIDGILMFSKYPVFVLCLDSETFDSIPPSDRVLKILDLNHRSDCAHIIYGAKLRASVASPFDCSLVLDADNVPNINVDDMLEIPDLEKYQFPLAPRHGADPDNYLDVMEFIGVSKKSMPYIHANYVFGPLGKSFMNLVLNAYVSIMANVKSHGCYDEAAINVMLWKNKAIHYLSVFDLWAKLFPFYISGDWDSCDHIRNRYYDETSMTFHLWHAEKDPFSAREILNNIASQDRSKFYSDPIMSRSPSVFSSTL